MSMQAQSVGRMRRHLKGAPFAGAALVALAGCAYTQSTSEQTGVPVSSADFSANCSAAGLCRVDLTADQKAEARSGAWQSAVAGVSEPNWVQWVDGDGDGAPDMAFLTPSPHAEADPTLSGRFSAQVTSQPDQQVQFVLSQRVGGRWSEGKLTGGDYVDVAALDVPQWHKQGTNWLRYEGPAWETREVGYRLYLDPRNGTDIFGKQIAELALHEHGRDGDDYHELKAWGADILKGGDSLGIGAPGLRVEGKVHRIAAEDGISARIVDHGPLFARRRVSSQGWRPSGASAISVETHYAITADSRLTRISTKADRAVERWVTGMVRHEGTSVIASDDDQEWQYLASFGIQSLFDDHLGMAVFYRKGDAEAVNDDPHSYLIAFPGRREGIDYYMGAWWQADPSGVSSIADFKQFLDRERAHLARFAGPVGQ